MKLRALWTLTIGRVYSDMGGVSDNSRQDSNDANYLSSSAATAMVHPEPTHRSHCRPRIVLRQNSFLYDRWYFFSVDTAVRILTRIRILILFLILFLIIFLLGISCAIYIVFNLIGHPLLLILILLLLRL